MRTDFSDMRYLFVHFDTVIKQQVSTYIHNTSCFALAIHSKE